MWAVMFLRHVSREGDFYVETLVLLAPPEKGAIPKRRQLILQEH